MNNEVVKQAKKYIGEKGLKFCKAYGYTTTVDWCVIFIWYIFKELKISKLLYDGKKVNNVGVLNDWLKANCKKVSIKDAVAGDIVVQSWYGYEQAHVGIVVKSNGLNSLQTIEGNAGTEACTKTTVKLATRYSGNIYAIYRPNYSKPKETKVNKPTETKSKTEAELTKMVKDVLQGKYGNGLKRKKALGTNYDRVQKEVNRILKLTANTIRGDYGNGTARKKSLGKDYELVQWCINNKLY